MRVAAFATAFVLLVVAVPALGWVGKERLLASQGGTVVEGGADPTEEGYRAYVDPTQTALVIQRDDDDVPVTLTVLALGAGQAGGTVLQVPLGTKTRNTRYLVDRIERVVEQGDTDAVVREVEDRLGIDLPEPIDLDDEDIAALIAPTAPLPIDNPDPVVTDGGEEFAAGDLNLAAEDVGPFLRATSEDDEAELTRLSRNEQVWSAWLEAIGRAGASDSIGAATTGIGPFLQVLADGEPVVETLSVEPATVTGEDDPPLVPSDGFDEQIIDAVPYPVSPVPGRRWNIKLLNGAEGSELPRPLLRDLILAGGSIGTLGNADEFEQGTTLVEFNGTPLVDAARSARFVLGRDTELKRMTPTRAEAEGADLVITIGEDTLDRYRELEEREGG